MEAKENGFEYMVFNYLAPKERGGLDFYRALAEKLNAAGEKCRETGLRLCYHNHDFEFEPKPGGRPIETLLQRLDKSLVRLEVDAFWVSMAGESAATFIRQNASRVEMVHLKDRKPRAPRTFDVASVPNDTFREVGNGDLNFRDILNSASEARVKHYFVEQDYSPDPLRSLRQSYENLRQLGF
jgi:sugar phosphate isomerase/epimerase